MKSDDAVRHARQAATADVQVTLDITPGVPHVFQAFYPILDEAAAALDRAATPVRAPGQRRPHDRLATGSTRCPHSPQAAGSHPAPATRKYKDKGLTAGNGCRAFHHPVPAHPPGIVNERSST